MRWYTSLAIASSVSPGEVHNIHNNLLLERMSSMSCCPPPDCLLLPGQCRLSRNLCPWPVLPLLLWCSNYNQITLIRTDIIPQWFRILWDTVYPFASVVGINGLTCCPAGLFLLKDVKRLDTCHEK